MNKILIFWFLLFSFVFAEEECTIGVASGSATADGRPLLWKTRDTSELDNEVTYNTSYDYPYIAVVNAGATYTWMGVNDEGLAILNSNAVDLASGSSGYSNGSLMRYALGHCANLEEFEAFLDLTNNQGRSTNGNFGVIDASGAAAIYEVGGTAYWKYDAQDSMQAPNGYILRTNFAENGDGVSGSGYERFDRTTDLIGGFYRGDTLNHRSILRHQMRDFSDFDSNPVPVPFPDYWISGRPYGYIYSSVSICRSTTVSATVFQGVKGNESPLLTTMWTMLGHPAASITVPFWPAGNTPDEANGSSTAPLCDASKRIRSLLFDYPENSNYIDSYKLLDGEGGGIWTRLFPAEDSVLAGAQIYLDQWRADTVLNRTQILAVENEYAEFALDKIDEIYTQMTTSISEQSDRPVTRFKLAQNYPNPFNNQTTITFTLPVTGNVSIEVFAVDGRRILFTPEKMYTQGAHSWHFNADRLTSGVYFYRFVYSQGKTMSRAVGKMTLIK